MAQKTFSVCFLRTMLDVSIAHARISLQAMDTHFSEWIRWICLTYPQRKLE